ncbi:leucine-rich repeat domain-containing protein [Pontibacter sp. G13]|uniref:leucine-rich repeat domain-containing protein n=1 Tax=Pontibacter sp. G13 TaxID=3074898 RepID=UPI00288B784E|nr:leucine-rich repeat domain-containing protein [Pontibacter sp. G13]WNJ16077.1 leucine-rich repeat domain-containing protein [Pontibacter sp. G13]
MLRILLIVLFSGSVLSGFSQVADSAMVSRGMAINPEAPTPSMPMLSARQLDNAVWYYSMDEAMREPEKVVKLSLKKKHLKRFPQELSRFPNLQVLNLSHNKIKELPNDISQFHNLQVLILSHNKIRSLPDAFRDMDNLKELYLGFNRLMAVPAWVGGLSKIEHIDLTRNNITTYEIERLKAKLPTCEITH